MNLNLPPKRLTLTVQLGPKGVAQFQEFLSTQHRQHADEACIFPGYEFQIGHWPPVDFWEVKVNVGSAFVIIDDSTVRLENSG